MFNHDVKIAIKRARLFSYEVAAALGISETSFSRKIARSELPDAEKRKIFEIINRLSNERSNHSAKENV